MKSEATKEARRLLRQKSGSPLQVVLPNGQHVTINPDMPSIVADRAARKRKAAAKADAMALVNTLSASVRARILKGKAGPPYDKVTKNQASNPKFVFDPMSTSSEAAPASAAKVVKKTAKKDTKAAPSKTKKEKK